MTTINGIKITLPALNGTEKQIAYGSDKRTEMVQAAADRVINRPAFKAQPEAVQVAFVKALGMVISEQIEAKYWIENSGAVLAQAIAVKASKITLGK